MHREAYPTGVPRVHELGFRPNRRSYCCRRTVSHLLTGFKLIRLADSQLPYRILKDWTIIDRLHLVRVPTFVINGRKDIAQDFVVKPFFDGIQKVKWVTFENSAHTPFFEEREKYMKLVGEFLV